VTLTISRPDFWAVGACRQLPADWFHPDRGEPTADAKAVCATCPVRVECLRWALDSQERFGIWGGTSERERRRIRRRVATGQPIPELDPDWVPSSYHGNPTWKSQPHPEPKREEPDVDLDVAPVALSTPTNGRRPTDPDTGLPTDACVNCGKRYTPTRNTQRFCRKECARAWYAAHPKSERAAPHPKPPQALATRDCETCGQPYNPGRKDQRFCSPACRAKHRNTRHYRPAAEVKAATAPPVPVPVSRPTTAGPGADIQALLGQLLAACDRWAIEADLGDIRVQVTRGCSGR
jgi:hypothetical protein